MPVGNHQAVPRLDQGDQQIGALPDDGAGRRPQLHPGHGRRGVSVMRPTMRVFYGIGIMAGALLLTLAPAARAQPAAVTKDDIIAKLGGFDSAPEIDVAALRTQVLERSKTRSKTDPPPNKRPLIAPELTKLPTINLDIQFDVDTP